MKKADFVTLAMSTIGGALFALGMCMCLIQDWESFDAGVVMGAVGAVVLLAMVVVRRRMLGKPAIKLSAKAVGIGVLAAVGALTLGIGMCMVMVWEDMLIGGIIVGLVGIALLLSLLPVCKGLK